MSDNVIDLSPAVRKRFAPCPCCGAPRIENNHAYARPYNCDCEQKIYGSCEICRYCKKHCRCSHEMKIMRAVAWAEYLKAVNRIRELYPDRVNQKEG